MAKDIARSAPPPATARKARPAAPKATPQTKAPRSRVRAAAAGDVTDTRSPASVQASRVARATERSQTVAVMALSDVLRRHAAGDHHAPGVGLDELKR